MHAQERLYAHTEEEKRHSVIPINTLHCATKQMVKNRVIEIKNLPLSYHKLPLIGHLSVNIFLAMASAWLISSKRLSLNWDGSRVDDTWCSGTPLAKHASRHPLPHSVSAPVGHSKFYYMAAISMIEGFARLLPRFSIFLAIIDSGRDRCKEMTCEQDDYHSLILSMSLALIFQPYISSMAHKIESKAPHDYYVIKKK